MADGNAHDRQLLSGWLAAAGYDVLVAGDGSEVVNTVRSRPLDLVLLNTSFPPDVAHGGGAFEDGFKIIEWLNRFQESEGVRFLLMTDEDAAQLQNKARATGAKVLFQKPVNQPTLLGVVQRILSGSSEPAE